MRTWLECRGVVGVAVFTALILLPDMVVAANHAVDDTLCNIIGAFSGGTGKAIETVCVIILGIMMMTGKLSLSSSMLELLGAGLLVGAGSVVIALGAGGSTICP